MQRACDEIELYIFKNLRVLGWKHSVRRSMKGSLQAGVQWHVSGPLTLV